MTFVFPKHVSLYLNVSIYTCIMSVSGAISYLPICFHLSYLNLDVYKNIYIKIILYHDFFDSNKNVYIFKPYEKFFFYIFFFNSCHPLLFGKEAPFHEKNIWSKDGEKTEMIFFGKTIL